MNIEEKINDCKFNLKQISHFEPDPFYVENFLKDYLISVNDFYTYIFEEVNRDFGMFVTEKCNSESITKRAIEKNDQKALEFVKWFNEKYQEEHKSPYPNFIMQTRDFFNKYSKLPTIKIMIRAKDRYKDDVVQEIKVKLSNGKLNSKEDLEIEIKRQLPIFLEVSNHKRIKFQEPQIIESQVIASSCMDIAEYQNMEIAYAAEIYIPLIERLLQESRLKIKELVSWTG